MMNRKHLPELIEQKDQVEKFDETLSSWCGSGGLSVVLLSLPVFLFDIIWYIAYQLCVLPILPDIQSKMMFYAMCLIAFQVIYGIISMGYGFVAIPASVLSFFVLVRSM